MKHTNFNMLKSFSERYMCRVLSVLFIIVGLGFCQQSWAYTIYYGDTGEANGSKVGITKVETNASVELSKTDCENEYYWYSFSSEGPITIHVMYANGWYSQWISLNPSNEVSYFTLDTPAGGTATERTSDVYCGPACANCGYLGEE